MAHPLNNSFENWTSPGTPGSVSGACEYWSAYSSNGGTSTREDTGVPVPNGGDYSVNIRSNITSIV